MRTTTTTSEQGGGKMTKPICRACGCSLVKLGISREHSARHRHDREEYVFCCQGCADLFAADSDKFLDDTHDLIVCPTCLAEKPLQWAFKLSIAGQEVHFFRCPNCAEVFQKNSDFYIQILKGRTLNEGVLDHEGCCARPQ